MSKLKAKIPEDVKPSKVKGLIFGASGVGKTWFSLDFPAPYYFDTEGGADLSHYQDKLKKAGGVYLGPKDGTLDFNFLIDQMQALATEKHEYKTLVIDSITKLFQTTIANESERLGSKDVFGASKKPAVNMMRRLLNWTTRLDMNVWFIAHEITEWGPGASGQREEIGKAPDVWDKLVYELHIGLRVMRRGKVYPATGIVYKSRLTGFPLNDSFDLTYDEFSGRYGKDFIESNVDSISLVDEITASEIKRLFEVLQINEEVQDKILTKANASKVEELTQAQGEDTLNWLNKKIKGEK